MKKPISSSLSLAAVVAILLLGCEASSDAADESSAPAVHEPADGPAPAPSPAPAPTPSPPPAPAPAPIVTADLFSVWSVAADDVLAVGAAGTILHYDGHWAAETSPTTNDLRAVWASAGGHAWAVGAAGTILRRDVNGWQAVASPTTNDLFGVWAASSDDAWAVGYGGLILHWDGVAWQVARAATGVPWSQGRLNAVWGRAANDVWAVGSGYEPDEDYAAILLHWDGATWTESYICNPEGTRFASGGWNSSLVDVWGTSDGSFWATGSCGPGAAQMAIGYVADKRDGASWRETTLAQPYFDYHHLRTIWASSSHDVWAASTNSQPNDGPPTILHYDGSTWTASPDPSTVDILDLAGSGPSDIWAVGPAGKRLHFDGTGWTAAP